MKSKKLYKFLQEGMKSNVGNHTWKIGEWYSEPDIKICKRGFHASKNPSQAFSYVQGEILAEVEVKGKSIKQDNKEVWSDMRIIKAYKWQKKDSVALSIFSAELCIKNYEKVYPNDKRPREAIEAAKKWLLEPTKENKSAARSAARSAAEAARSAESAKSAAWSAWAAESAESAKSAAWSAESAARSAAEASAAAWAAESAAEAAEAAWSAAWSAAEAWSAKNKIVNQISKWFIKHIKNLEEIK